jgi:hypothetical protein
MSKFYLLPSIPAALAVAALGAPLNVHAGSSAEELLPPCIIRDCGAICYRSEVRICVSPPKVCIAPRHPACSVDLTTG